MAEPRPPESSSVEVPQGRRQRLGFWIGLLVCGIVLVSPVPEGLSVAGWRTAAVGSLMAIWWMTEALPIAATALLPMILFPILDILPIREATAPYANPLIFLFMGGFVLALGMQRWGLHRRIALGIIRRTGTQPAGLILGFMIAGAFLSMWISNTATAMILLPIGLSVIELVETPTAKRGPFAIGLMLGIAYACSLGGLGTLIGTPTNALLAGLLAETYGVELAFFDWMLIGLPLVILGVGLTFFVLTRWVYPVDESAVTGGDTFLETEIQRLGPITKPEKMVALVFGGTALLWMTRPLLRDWVPGLSDTGIAIFGALLLFILPVSRGQFLLNWHWAERLPWGVLILFGGGLSLAGAVQQSGLADWIGASLAVFANWPIILLILLVVAVVILLTELTSNTATAAAFLPVMAALAIGIGQNPLLLMIPATIAASCAFMLPVATPPNAIVYGSGFLTIPQMARPGIVLNLLFALFVTGLCFLLLPWAFDLVLGTVPDWATAP